MQKFTAALGTNDIFLLHVYTISGISQSTTTAEDVTVPLACSLLNVKLVVLFAFCEEKKERKKKTGLERREKASLYANQMEAHEGEGKLIKEAFVVEKEGNEGSASKAYRIS